VPGSDYNITLSPEDPGYAETGVASINTRKPIYRPNEKVELVAVVLDTSGYLVEGADVLIEITDPRGRVVQLSTSKKTVKETSRGIYETEYTKTPFEGRYSVFVRAFGDGVDSSMLSYFDIAENYAFDISRNTPVTTDPWNGPFHSSISIISFVDADNFIYTELLPINFEVIDSGGGTVSDEGIHRKISWSMLKSGAQVHYSALPPYVTPDLYALGPSQVTYIDEGTGDLLVFEEARPWYIAIDPLRQVNATGCAKMVSTNQDNQYTTSCTSPWNIDAQDLATQNASADNNRYCGIQTTHDTTFVNCAEVKKVEVCIDWWFTGNVKSCSGVQYSSNGVGGAWTTVAGSSCPTANGPLICSDVTAGAAWNCTSFSSANTAIRAHLRSNTNGALCRFDAVFFNVTYAAYPDITGTVINSGPVAEGDAITFTGSCTDLDSGDAFRLVVCNASSPACDASTTGNNLICNGTNSASTTPSCTYLTASSDIKTHSGDKAVCCDVDNHCDPTPVTVEEWTVTTLSGPPVITINDVEGDSSSPYSFTNPSPVVNSTLNRNGYCFLCEYDLNFTQMSGDSECVDCGWYSRDVSKSCEYTNSLPIGMGTDYLYMSCNNTKGGENSIANNANIQINVLCDSHLDCNSSSYCAVSQLCVYDQQPGYSCQNRAYGGGNDHEVCRTGAGATALCVNDSSFSYTGWYCTADENDCVYNNEGKSYDLNYALCIENTHNYRVCGAGNEWGAVVYCAEQFDPYDRSASASHHAGEYCVITLSPKPAPVATWIWAHSDA